MKTISKTEYNTYHEWNVGTNSKWCSYVVQKYLYDQGVVLEEFDEDDEFVECHILENFPKKSLPYFNQEKDTISIIVLKENIYEK